MNKKNYSLIVKEKGQKIFNYLLKILKQREDAEDVYQQVFIKFLDKVDSVNEKAYDSYLFRMAYNNALNYINKRNKVTDLTDDHIANLEASKEKEESNNNNIMIKNYLSQIPTNQATAIELKVFQRKRYKEITIIMGLSESAVESLLVRARKNLRKIIAKEKRNVFVLSNGGQNEM